MLGLRHLRDRGRGMSRECGLIRKGREDERFRVQGLGCRV